MAERTRFVPLRGNAMGAAPPRMRRDDGQAIHCRGIGRRSDE
jgi:hypothetical protein